MLNDISIFLKVVECQSFVKTAEALNLSKPAVSKYITRLESELGVRLLNRTTRRLSLTEAGHIFYQHCLKGLQEIELGQSEIAQLQKKPSGLLRVNAPMSFGVLHIAPLISEFTQKFPSVDIDLNLNDEQIDMIKEEFDISIRISELPVSSLISKKLTNCNHVIVASPQYLKENGVPQTPDDLSTHKIVGYKYQFSPYKWSFSLADGETLTVPVKKQTQINNSLAVKEVVKNGGGIARMPLFSIIEEIEKGELVPILQHYKQLEIAVYALYIQKQYMSPKVRVFLDFLVEKFAHKKF